MTLDNKVRKTGILYVVATPIGNLEDITLRAIRILNEVNVIAAEDTRHTRKLLSHLDIHTPLISYYKGKEVGRAKEIIVKLQQGEDVALVSDAGTPGISDPGAILVNEALAVGITVTPVPGPSALTATLSVSGFDDKKSLFLGFLPGKQNERRKLLQSLVGNDSLLVFYESPKRIKKSLADCLTILGDRQAFMAREISKIYEELLQKSLAEICHELGCRKQIKGEFVVVIKGAAAKDERPDIKNLDELLIWYRDKSDLSMRDAVKTITADLNLCRSEVYRQALDIWDC